MMSRETIRRGATDKVGSSKPIRMVSIIVPVYNAEKYLERGLNSIINQTFRDIEVIIVNDGSTDGSKAICDKYAKTDRRIKIISQENKGASAARNVGLRKAKGDYITFADSDDWLELDAIKNMVRLLEQEDVDCIRTSLYRDYPSREIASKLSLKPGKYSRDDIHKVLPAFVSGREQCYVYLLLFKKDLLSKIKPFNEKLHMMEDTCFYMDVFTNVGSIYFSDTKTYHYFESEGSVTRSPERYIRNFRDVLVVNVKLKKILQKAGLLTRRVEEAMDLEHVRLVSEYAYMAYENVPGGGKGVISALRAEKGLRELANRVNLSNLTFGHRYTTKYLLSEDGLKLSVIFKARHFIDYIQTLRMRVGI